MNPALRVLLPAWLSLLAALALGQANVPPTAKLELSKKPVKTGATIPATVTVTFAEGLHAYQNPPSESYMIPLTIKSSSKDVTLKSVKYPPGVDEIVGGSTAPVKTYEGTIKVPIVLQAPKKGGSFKVALDVGYQQCNANNCFGPSSVPLTATLVVEAPKAPPAKTGSGPIGKVDVKKPGEKPTGKDDPVKSDPSKVDPGKPDPAKTDPQKAAPPQKDPGTTTTGAEPDTPKQTDPNAVGSSESTRSSTPTSSSDSSASSSTSDEDEGFIMSNLKKAFQSGNYMVVILLALLTGLALAVTPCVYPMIPITVGFFSNQTAGNKAARAWLGLMYMFGLAVTYGVVGGLSAALGGTIGSLFQATWFLFALGLLMAVLALSMFDVYEIRLPAFLGKQIHGRSGAVGALIMGLLMGFAAAPCAGPVLTVYAVKVAEYQNLPLGLLLFTLIGVGLGLPFFALGAISTGAKTLPRAGGWLKTLKALLGIVVLYVALNYFLQAFQVRTDSSLGLLIKAVFLVLSAGYLFLFEQSGSTKVIWGMKGAAILLCGLVAGQLLEARNVTAIVQWIPFTQESFAAAKASGKPIVIDASADWCLICHEIDAAVFKKPEGAEAMRDVVALRIDHSAGVDQKYVDMTTQMFNIRGLPHIEIMKPGGEIVKTITGKAELDTPDELREYLALARR